MGKEGWEHLDKACPNSGCTGMLQLKAAGAHRLAVKCTHGDFEKRGTDAQITEWLKGVR